MRKTSIKALFLIVGALSLALPLGAQSLTDATLQIGDWAKAEAWHSWIGGESRSSTVRLNVVDEDNLIQRVDFYYSIDNGLTWTLFGTDTNGQEPLITTNIFRTTPLGTEPLDPAVLAPGDGWSAVFYHNTVPQVNMKILFRAVAALEGSGSFVAGAWRKYDPTPPDEAVVTYSYINRDTLLVSVADPYFNIDSVTIVSSLDLETFYKGIPGVSQHPNSDWHCVPAAVTACLKYFANKGDPTITGGLTDSSLVDTLGDMAHTDTLLGGTKITDMVAALIAWIQSHGDNYTVRHIGFDWNTASNELKRCQDVIMLIEWDGPGGHEVTFNSIVSTPNPDGTIRVDFMDPWTGEIEWGDLDPNTGRLTGFGDNGACGTMADMMIVCPNENNPYISPGVDPIGGGKGPNPIPQPVPLSQDNAWQLRVHVVDLDGNAYTFTNLVSAVTLNDNLQGTVVPNFYIAQNTPNPFSNKTEITFALPKSCGVTVTVYDASGAKVATLAKGDYKAGVYKLSLDAKAAKLQPGVYFARLETDTGYRQSVKMLLVK